MMKPTYRFRDQVNALSAWFKEWNDCEQTVALYSLLKRVSGPQAKFLTLVLEQTLTDSEEWSRLGQEANDPALPSADSTVNDGNADFINEVERLSVWTSEECDLLLTEFRVPAYLSSLCNESIESAVAQLLNHLPFLKPGSKEAKAEYLSLIPKILTHSVEKGMYLEDSRQLLSYLLIHPALTNEERSSLAWWLGRLEEQTNAVGSYCTKPSPEPSPIPSPFPCGLSSDVLPGRNGLGSKLNGWRSAHKPRDSGFIELPCSSHSMNSGSALPKQPLTYTLSAPPAVNVTGPDPIGSTAGLHLPPHHRNRRSHSLTPPESSAHSAQPYMLDWPSSPEDLETPVNRSLSLPNEHAPLSPQSSTASSGSSTETHPEDGSMLIGHPPLQKRNSFLEENSGMRDVPTWLKSLRLHKYQGLFQQMSYDEMMGLTEEDLERMNVTRGARHKIVISVAKLKERQMLLQNLEKDIMSDNSPGILRNALNHIKNILMTPIKPYGSSGMPDSSSMVSGFGHVLPPESPTESEQGPVAIPEGDLCGQITRFMGKMCTQLLVSRRPDEDNISLYLQLLDKSLNHESFTATQKKRLYSWRQSCQKFSRNPFQRKLSLQETKQARPWAHYSTNYPADYGMFPGGAANAARRLGRPAFSQLSQPRINPLLTAAGTNQPGVFRPTQSSSMYVKPRPLQGNPHAGVTRTKSAPIRRSSQPTTNSSLFGILSPGQLDSQFLGEPELNNRLETLCLSVTEHALADMDQMNEPQLH